CSEEPHSVGASSQRVDSVAPHEEGPPDDFCEIRHNAGEGQPLTFPTLATGTAPAPGGPRWINVWASWCPPCVEEMPMLQQWSQRLRASGAPVQMVFLSADATDDAVASFRRGHPGAPDSLRVSDPQAIPAWLPTVGLDQGAPLPIHIFTDAQGRVRCAR